jgi:hypothetical protein
MKCFFINYELPSYNVPKKDGLLLCRWLLVIPRDLWTAMEMTKVKSKTCGSIHQITAQIPPASG